jgi:hypothetical protein
LVLFKKKPTGKALVGLSDLVSQILIDICAGHQTKATLEKTKQKPYLHIFPSLINLVFAIVILHDIAIVLVV